MMNSILSSQLFCKLHFRNVFSTEAHSHTLISQFLSSKLNLSDAHISRILESCPHVQNLPTLHEVEKIIQSFQKRGFSQVEIAKIARIQPRVVGYAATTLEANMKLLEDFGLVDRNLVKLLTINPTVLSLGLKSNLLPKMEFLKNLFQSQVELVKALVKAPGLINYNLEKVLKPSLAFWDGWGFSGTKLVDLLRLNPNALSCTSLTPAQVGLINMIFAGETGKMYKYVVNLVAVSRVETLEAKIENLIHCGISAEEVGQLIRSYPLLLHYSRENVSEKMNFLVNDMELPVNYVAKHPWLLQISFKKAMWPRCLVLRQIKSIIDFPLLSLLRMSEARFASRIIEGHPESKTLWTIYENALSNANNRTKSSARMPIWMGKVRVTTQ